MRITSRRRLASGALLAAAVSVVGCGRSSTPSRTAAVPSLLGSPGAPATSRDDLNRTVREMDARLAAKPNDATAAVRLADALLRQTRVTGNAGLSLRAEAVLQRALANPTDDYALRRMLATVYLSQHRFKEALVEAERCRNRQPNDAWVYGAIGDAHLELGEYDEAFDAFDRMAAIKPNAASYARVSYAHELRGDLPGAIRLMTMATEGTGPQDPEAAAWQHAQLGHLQLALGRLDDAEREFAHAAFIFPEHPFALDGLARVKQARGDVQGALDLVTKRLAASATPADWAFAGDLLSALGRHDEAERRYQLAEAAWTSDVPEPARLARFLADHGRRVHDAVTIAERAAKDRRDIFTEDALAWAYFRDGQIAKAHAAIQSALRTGTKDRDIRAHAEAIAKAAGRGRP